MKIGVIGGGAFGTAMASVFAIGKHDVTLWARSTDCAHEINTTHINSTRLEGVNLPKNLTATCHLEALHSSEVIFLVLPAQTTRAWLSENHDALPDVPVICCAKGIDRETTKFQSALVHQYFPKRRIAVLSGPGFAKEVAAGKPTAMALAAFDDGLAHKLCDALSTQTLRLYPNNDIMGTELGGAIKNIIAIGCGVTIGAGLGQSARAALLTRGFAEMVRLGLAMGAKAETMGGLAGLGDLTLTATSETSRNYARGLELGQGIAPSANRTTEGAYTARVALNLAEEHGLELPVIATTARLIEGEISVKDALEYLISRPVTKEF